MGWARQRHLPNSLVASSDQNATPEDEVSNLSCDLSKEILETDNLYISPS